MNNTAIAAHHGVVFPPEIADRIMSYLHDDKATLKACSLTCRPWYLTALYHTIHFHSTTMPYCAHGFANLLTHSPHIGSFVRELSLTLLSDSYSHLSPILKLSKHLGNVHTLTLCGLFTGRYLTVFGAVCHIRLFDPYCTCHTFVSVFNAFPSLVDFALDAYTAKPTYGPIDTLPAWPLKKLRLTPMITPMTKPPSFPLLRANPQSISHFELQIYHVLDDTQVLELFAALELFQALRNLSLVTPSLASLASLMPRLQWPGIDKLTLGVFPRSMSDVDTLIRVLSDADFSSASKVVLRLQCMRHMLYIQRDMGKFRTSLEESLKGLCARGVLSVVI
ncbi:uncharacterized protein LAESUDRAFT_760431 [Laetiporus sulphureus 93-53]|uniref:Uncharacterized protein n=1 Tax=Laetiporus sulphureus 93-53 TaxID=1314785 RepID=A0A165DN83_9APHY|nr:uncharacterized protein LAESUDRAFT_760431 [Laetiporus sulphureus 93-53]KZT05255.1 hypothetical protein LAESUDRAFT_760431 [Laetiporus sulphureus 93-53]